MNLQPVQSVFFGQLPELVPFDDRQRFLRQGHCSAVQTGDGDIASGGELVRFVNVQRVVQLDVQPAIVLEVGLGARIFGFSLAIEAIRWSSRITAFSTNTRLHSTVKSIFLIIASNNYKRKH